MQRRTFSHAERTTAADGDYPDRLVRLIEELRAIDLERRKQPVSSAAFRELARRMEVKAREVFELAATSGPSATARIRARQPDATPPRRPH
jgi:hypothetical protein